MLDTAKKDLIEVKDKETAAEAAFLKVQATKQDEIAVCTKQLEEKKKIRAEARERQSVAFTNLSAEKKQVKETTTLLETLTVDCDHKAKEFMALQKNLAEE